MKNLLLFLSVTLFFFSCRKAPVYDPYGLPDSYSNQTVGQSANDLLSGVKYSKIVVEIKYMPGYQLEATAVANVGSFLFSLCQKPDSIVITQTEIPGGNDTLNPSEIAALEKKYRTAYTTGKTISLCIIVTSGYDTSAKKLGFAFRNTSICLFGKNIFDNSGGFGKVSRVALETSVMEHELGHLLGLVNLGTPMVRAHMDGAHSGHCSNPDCLMYHELEIQRTLSNASNVAVLDSNCRNDLRANGGK